MSTTKAQTAFSALGEIGPKLLDVDARMTTDRLELAPLRHDYADELFPVLSDVTLYEYTRNAPPASLAELRERYRYLESRQSPDGTEVWLNWVLVEIAMGIAIGYVQATVNSKRADVAWLVGTPWQRRGFATEAARALVIWLRCAGVREVRARISPGHTASQRVAVGAGLAPTCELIDGETVWARSVD